MKLITLSGTDGSGKSTQLALLRSHFERMGKKVAYFHAVEFSLANRLGRSVKGGQDFSPGKDTANTDASFISRSLRRIFFAIDLIRFRFLLRTLERDGTDILLSDRYFYDTFINLAYLSLPIVFRCPGERFIPRPDAAFFLDIDPVAVMRRERIPEQGVHYLETKRDLFREKVSEWRLIRIEADAPIDEVFHRILSSAS